jgi:hypothetical protein
MMLGKWRLNDVQPPLPQCCPRWREGRRKGEVVSERAMEGDRERERGWEREGNGG